MTSQVQGSFPKDCLLFNFRCQSQVQVVICASDWLAVNQRFLQPLVGFNWFVRAAHRTQKTGHSLDHWFITKDIEDMNEQPDAQVHRSRRVWGTGALSLWSLGYRVHHGVLQHVEMFLFTNRQLSKPVLSDLCGGFLTWAWLYHRLLVISLPSRPSPLPERGWQGGTEIPTLIHGWFSWQPAPILSGFPQVTSLTQTQVWWKGLGMNNRTCLSTLLLWTYFRKWRKRGQMA